MPIEWPDGEEAERKPRRTGSYWGGVPVSARNDWFARERSGPSLLPILIVAALVLVASALLYVYGPLPPLFPRDCVGCFFSHP
jgi:hypothetical protein